MSRGVEDLVPEFHEKVQELLEACTKGGFEIKPYFTLRTPAEQCRLWRQSRTTAEIREALAMLRDADAPFLADTVEEVGPQSGEHVTNALPGRSWHQWGEAVDCFWVVDGKAQWSTRRKLSLPEGRSINGYRLYAEIAKDQCLEAGGLWSSIRVNVEHRRHESPSQRHLPRQRG